MGLLAVAGVVNLQDILDKFQGKSITTTSKTNAVVTAEHPCGSGDLANLEVRWRNGANIVSADYKPARLTLVNSETGDVLRTVNTASDGTFVSTSSVAECGKSFYVVILNNATNVASKSEIKVADSPILRFDVVGANSSEIVGNMYSLSFGNETKTSTAFATGSQDFTTVTNTALGTGDSVTTRFDVGTQDSNSQFGSSERICETNTGVCGRAFICGTGASSIYGLDDISVSAPFVLGRTTALPNLCATSTPTNAGVGRVAFEIDAIKSSAGRQSGTYFTKSGLGNAADTNNVRFIYMDNAYYQGSNGKLKVGTSDDTSTDTGETNRYMEIDIT